MERVRESVEFVSRTDATTYSQETSAAKCPNSFTLGLDLERSSSLTERRETNEAENSSACDISPEISEKSVQIYDVHMTQVLERANAFKVGDRVLAEEDQTWYVIT